MGLILGMGILFADSPVTYANFYKKYKTPLVEKTLPSDKGSLDSNIQAIEYLVDDSVALDVKLAIINKLGWTFKGHKRTHFLGEALKKKHGWQSIDEIETKGSADELVVYAYLLANDNYFDVEQSLDYVKLALQKKTKSYAIHFIHTLLEAQQIQDSSLCGIYREYTKLDKTGLDIDIDEDAIANELSYMKSYKKFCVSFEEAVRYYQVKKYKKAFDILVPMANKGDNRAQNLLALLFLDGSGTQKNIEKAEYWFKQAIANGNVRAMRNLALNTYVGYGFKKDYKVVFKYTKMAVEHKMEKMYDMLGMLYTKGLGTPKDEVKGLKWFKKAAKVNFYGRLNEMLWKMYEEDSYTKKIFDFLELLEQSDNVSDLDTVATIYKALGDKQKAVKIYKERIMPKIYKENDIKRVKKFEGYFEKIKG